MSFRIVGTQWMYCVTVNSVCLQLKNDALFVPTNADGYRGKDFALIGLETKKALSKANMDQKLAQFLAWALRSNSAYIQVRLATYYR